ncbi:MAG: hypothetical protein QOE61_4396, partial [Micromonosporaceae bacterium]|nr:hypothetical protein [Micromonosporaceae bacterium]
AAFEDLAAEDSLRLLGRAPDPARAAKLTRGQLIAALRAARRHHVEAKADVLLTALRAPALRQPPTLEGAYAAIVVGQVGLITALNEQITQLQKVMAEHFGRHPAADIYLSQPGFGVVLGARALGEFGDDPTRFTDARARKNYSGQSPITRASGKKSVVLARYACNRRLGAALHLQAFAALGASPGARAYYDTLRGRKIGHHAALRQLANRLVGILHDCLKTATLYDEDTVWRTTAPPPSPSRLDEFRLRCAPCHYPTALRPPMDREPPRPCHVALGWRGYSVPPPQSGPGRSPSPCEP